jgi:hypothetical protein
MALLQSASPLRRFAASFASSRLGAFAFQRAGTRIPQAAMRAAAWAEWRMAAMLGR